MSIYWQASDARSSDVEGDYDGWIVLGYGVFCIMAIIVYLALGGTQIDETNFAMSLALP